MMEYSFKAGDIVVFKETETTIGCYNLSFQSRERMEKDKTRYRRYRWEVIRILEGRVDKDGDPCFRLRRLDTNAKGLETWSQGSFVHEELKAKVGTE